MTQNHLKSYNLAMMRQALTIDSRVSEGNNILNPCVNILDVGLDGLNNEVATVPCLINTDWLS